MFALSESELYLFKFVVKWGNTNFVYPNRFFGMRSSRKGAMHSAMGEILYFMKIFLKININFQTI